MKSLISRFVKDESGATAIEYGLIAGLLSVVLLGALQLTGGSLSNVFIAIQTQLDTVKADIGS
jgi:pilus assembly protein Flp/PilA